jgi:hypothetical protein
MHIKCFFNVCLLKEKIIVVGVIALFAHLVVQACQCFLVFQHCAKST